MFFYKKAVIFILFIIIISCSQSQSIEQLVENEHYEAAVNLLENEIIETHKHSDYVLLMTIYNNKLGRYFDALNILKQYKMRFHNIDDIKELASIILTNSAGEMYISENIDSSMILLTESIKLNNKYSRTYKILAKCYAKKEIIDTAAIFINKAIDLDTNDKESYLIQGNICYLNSDGANAQKSYLKAIEIDSLYYEAYINLGTLYYNTDNYNYAVRVFKNAIKIDSLGILAYDYIINIYSGVDLLDSAYKYAKLFEEKKQESLIKNENK